MASARSVSKADSARAALPHRLSAEARWLAIGLALAGASLAAIGVGWLVRPELALKLAAMTGLNLLIGRAAGLSYGFAAGLDPLPVVLANMLVETVQVLIVYPLVVIGWRNLPHLPRLRPWLERLRVDAQSRQGWAQRFGIAGLFAFVFVPFWMTGPVVGAIIGFLLGLRSRVIVATVLSATYVAIVVWAAAIGGLSAMATAAQRWAIFLAIVALALVALAWRAAARRR
jgi:uncharacterized membrane protein